MLINDALSHAVFRIVLMHRVLNIEHLKLRLRGIPLIKCPEYGSIISFCCWSNVCCVVTVTFFVFQEETYFSCVHFVKCICAFDGIFLQFVYKSTFFCGFHFYDFFFVFIICCGSIIVWHVNMVCICNVCIHTV